MKKDSLIILSLFLIVTVFFHYRSVKSNNSIDELAGKISSLEENVNRIAVVTSTEIKNIKSQAAVMETSKQKKEEVDVESSEALKKSLEALALDKSVRIANVILCDGDESVLKLLKDKTLLYYEPLSTAVSNPTGQGSYKIEGPFFIYSAKVKDEKGKSAIMSGRGYINSQSSGIIKGVQVESTSYSTSKCTKSTLAKFR